MTKLDSGAKKEIDKVVGDFIKKNKIGLDNARKLDEVAKIQKNMADTLLLVQKHVKMDRDYLQGELRRQEKEIDGLKARIKKLEKT